MYLLKGFTVIKMVNLINVCLGKENLLFWRVCDTRQKADCVNKVKKEIKIKQKVFYGSANRECFLTSSVLRFLDWSVVEEDLTLLHFNRTDLQNNGLFDPLLLTTVPCINHCSICTNSIPAQLCLLLLVGYSPILPLAACKIIAALWEGARFAPKPAKRGVSGCPICCKGAAVSNEWGWRALLRYAD